MNEKLPLRKVEAVRSRPETAGVPVVAHMASDSAEDRRRAEALGVSGYVIKGFGTALHLAAVVDAVLAPMPDEDQRGPDVGNR